MEDHSIDPDNYGKGAKGKAREGSPQIRLGKEDDLEVKVEEVKASRKVSGTHKKVRESTNLLLKDQVRVMAHHPSPPGPAGNFRKLPLHGQNPKLRRQRGPPKEIGPDLLPTHAWTIQILPLPLVPTVWPFWAPTQTVWSVKIAITLMHYAQSPCSRT